MHYTFEKKDLNTPLFATYLSTLTGPVDDFWEDHIFRADLYIISREKEPVGIFTILMEDTPRITAFWVNDSVSTKESESIFEQILTEFQVKHAFVLTCDEHFLSLCMTYQTCVEIQAYQFSVDNTANVRPTAFGAECMQRVAPAELPEVSMLTDGFFDEVTAEDLESGAAELWRVVEHGETLGFGVIIPDKLRKDLIPCGEIVLEAHRRKGVARSLQLFMHKRCAELGGRHVGGCWFHNKLSRDTFDSAGLYAHTRLLNVTF